MLLPQSALRRHHFDHVSRRDFGQSRRQLADDHGMSFTETANLRRSFMEIEEEVFSCVIWLTSR